MTDVRSKLTSVFCWLKRTSDHRDFVIHGRSGSEADAQTRGSMPRRLSKHAAYQDGRWRLRAPYQAGRSLFLTAFVRG